MKKLLLSVLVFTTLAMIASCSKDTDNAAKWVGVYASSGTLTDSVNQVTIIEVNGSTLQLLLQGKYNGSVYTLATIQNAKLTSATTIDVNETGNIAGLNSPYAFTGSGVLTGNALTISGHATNTTNSNDIRGYYFTGSK